MQSQSRTNLVDPPTSTRPKLITFCQTEDQERREAEQERRGGEQERRPSRTADNCSRSQLDQAAQRTTKTETTASNQMQLGTSGNRTQLEIALSRTQLEAAASRTQLGAALRICSEVGGSRVHADLGRTHFAVEAVAARLDAVDRFLGPEEV